MEVPFNEFLVGVIGCDIAIVAWGKRITRQQALFLAAYIVSIADENDEFQTTLKAICGE